MLARAEPEERACLQESIDLLNEVLAHAGLQPHHEPDELPSDAVFEAQMMGYSGLHDVRRLAAHHMMTGRLPPPMESRYDSADDPMIAEANNRALLGRRRPPAADWLGRLMGRKPPVQPIYFHLLLHSDCEGFYVPQDFDEVIFDDANPQREGLGGMVGSSVRLLAECWILADLIDLPPNIDPEAADLWAVSDEPAQDGPLWRVYGVESFGLARLIRGCELSVRHRALLVFC